ncbi:MAG: hypothetical protein RR623_09940 [Bacilli bacterium]
MKRLKWLFIFLLLTYYHYSYLENFAVTKITDVFASYSGKNAIVLHFSVYICVICLMNIEYFRSVKSEFLIRMNRLDFIKKYIKKSMVNSICFLLLFYLSGSFFVIYYLGINQYFTRAAYIPCALSIIIYAIIYVIFSIILMIIFICIKKVILSVTITTVLAIIIGSLFKQSLWYLSFFEMFHDGIPVFFPFIQILVITLFILIVFINILMEVFQRRDLIYEEKL